MVKTKRRDEQGCKGSKKNMEDSMQIMTEESHNEDITMGENESDRLQSSSKRLKLEIETENSDMVVGLDQWIIIKMADNSTKLVKITKNQHITIYKHSLSSSLFPGLLYGVDYEIEDSKIIKSENPLLHQIMTSPELCTTQVKRDNRNLNDNSTAQKLTAEEIENLKGQLTSTELIDTLIENSATFASKTEFSQEKYIKRKRQKFCTTFQMIKVNAMTLATHLFTHNPHAILYLRPDTLSQILSSSGIRPGSRAIIYDDEIRGLVTGAILERVATDDRVLLVSQKECFSSNQIYGYNIENSFFKTSLTDLLTLNREQFQSAHIKKPDDFVSTGLIITEKITDSKKQLSVNDDIDEYIETLSTDEDPSQRPIENSIDMEPLLTEEELHSTGLIQTNPTELDDSPSQAAVRIVDDHSKDKGSILQGKSAHYKEKQAQLLKSFIHNRPFDALIIVSSKTCSLSLLKELKSYLAPSRNIVIYSPYKESLFEVFEYARKSPDLIHVTLTESCLQIHQVLPGRTHPEMQTSGSGGYLLTMTLVLSLD